MTQSYLLPLDSRVVHLLEVVKASGRRGIETLSVFSGIDKGRIVADFGRP